MMTQRGGSLSYLTFGAGFSLFVYLLFYVVSDLGGIRIGVFEPLVPMRWLPTCWRPSSARPSRHLFRECAAWYVIAAFCVDFFLLWLFVRTLEKNNIFLRV